MTKPSAEIIQLEPLCIRLKEVAQLLGISERTLATMRSCGKLPPAIRLGGCLLYPVSDLKLWVSLGCPPLEKFVELKETVK